MRLKYILALLVGIGIMFSVRDYKSWRREETKNYGKGPELNNELGIMNYALTEIYQNEIFRIKYPEGWDVEKMVRWEETEKNLPDVVDEERAKIGKLDREPDHVDTDITVLTWEGKQMAITKGGKVVVRIEGPDGGIVGEMAKSLVFF